MDRIWICCAALLGGSAVAMGAYHAHGLRGQLGRAGLDEAQIAVRLDQCETAVRYQMYHSLAANLGVSLRSVPSSFETMRGGAMIIVLSTVIR